MVAKVDPSGDEIERPCKIIDRVIARREKFPDVFVFPEGFLASIRRILRKLTANGVGDSSFDCTRHCMHFDMH